MDCEELLNWFDLHFHPSTFHGRLQIGYRKKNSAALLPLVTHERDEMADFLSKMFIRRDYDYYITANCVSGVERRKESLFSFHNIVIDVDCHVGEPPSDDVLDGIFWRFKRDLGDLIPLPTSVVFTGRGLQFWWALEPLHVKCKYYYDLARNALIEVLELFLSCHYGPLEEDFSVFQVDKGASTNDVGYFRLPFSYHSKVGKRVNYAFFPEKKIHILQDLVSWAKGIIEVKEELTEIMACFSDLDEQNVLEPNDAVVGESCEKINVLEASGNISDELDVKINATEAGKEISSNMEHYSGVAVEDQEFVKNFRSNDVFLLKNIETLAFFRLRQIVMLRHLRQEILQAETRNNLNFMLYNTLLPVLGHEESWKRLSSFNQGFRIPMEKKEMEAVIVSAKQKGGYRYSNEKMIKFLEISQEEQEKIGLFMGKAEKICRYSKNPSRDASRALQKSQQVAQVQKYAKNGKNRKEIALLTGLSAPTVRKILEEFDNKDVKKERALMWLQQGKSTKETAMMCGISVRTVQRLQKEFHQSLVATK